MVVKFFLVAESKSRISSRSSHIALPTRRKVADLASTNPPVGPLCVYSARAGWRKWGNSPGQKASCRPGTAMSGHPLASSSWSNVLHLDYGQLYAYWPWLELRNRPLDLWSPPSSNGSTSAPDRPKLSFGIDAILSDRLGSQCTGHESALVNWFQNSTKSTVLRMQMFVNSSLKEIGFDFSAIFLKIRNLFINDFVH